MSTEHGADNKRRRGIQASPAKLRKALADAGLKSQNAVAEKIADLESLDSPPRGLVNRVWRGEAVDPQSLERVARALGVPGWTLYRSSDEPPDRVPAPPPPKPPPGARRSSRVPIWATLVLLITIVGWWWLSQRGAVPASPATPVASARLGVVLLPIAAPKGEEISSALGAAINQHWRLLPQPDEGVGKSLDPQELLLLGGIDRVIEARVLDSGRWRGLVLLLHQRGAMREVWGGVWRRSMAPQNLSRLWTGATAALMAPTAAEALQSRAAVERFLSARLNLDSVNTELNNRRALTDFDSALRLAPEFIEARAGLCEALVLDNVRTGDATRLTEAARECDAALQADDKDLEARRALAYLDRRRGRLSEALGGFTAVLAETPDNVDALLGLAEVNLTRHSRGEDPQAFDAAVAAARRAAQIEPAFWKVPFTLARILYGGEQLDAAIAAAEDSVRLDPNVLALSNLGSFQFCKGNLVDARAAYERARQADPATFVGEAQLGVVMYFQREFAQAARLFKTALDLQARGGKPEVHRLWGNYADALRWSRDTAGAEQAYARAIALAQRDATSGDGNPLHAIYLAYFREMLAATLPQRWNSQRVGEADLRQLQAAQDPLAQLHLAAVYRQRGNVALAAKITASASVGCPGFLKSPDL
ncbi:MAG: tetratricopeptide repeat protein [Proteobacteria bacterium]|nr:tetratricopeptide repeat protein [Pseudomonadota bacterium]